MSDPLLSIRNRHILGSGDPPIFNNDDPNVYTGYFVNEHGEQWIFTYDRSTTEAVLRGGDIGWNNPVEVVGGKPADLILSETEALWLHACCKATRCL
jgi:hypothetical protein